MFCNCLNEDQKALACEIINRSKNCLYPANFSNLHWFKRGFLFECIKMQEKNLTSETLPIIQEIINVLNENNMH